jgi:NADPH-ferrihemoprotein reductase
MPPPAPLPGAAAVKPPPPPAAAAKVAPAPAAAPAAAAPKPAAPPPAKVVETTTKVVTPVVADAADATAAPAPAAPAPAPAAAAKPAPAPTAGPAPALTGSAAILARMRSQKQQAAEATTTTSSSSTTTQKPRLVVAYASQTGTAQEIARNVAAEALERANKLGDACPYLPPPKGAALSFNQLGWQRVGASETPLLVVVAASTGDGEPPDNSAVAYVAMRKNGQELGKRLKGVRATVLGLGDSNYTRYMAVPRAIRGRMTDLGAETFYPGCDADEVDGLEGIVDPWVEGLWPALEAAGRAWMAEHGGGGAAEEKKKEEAAAAAPVVAAATAAAVSPAPATAPSPALSSSTAAASSTTAADMPAGVPALAPTRIRLVFEGLSEEVVAAARARDAASARGSVDNNDANNNRSASPTADSPAYVRVSEAKLMTAEWSDRRVVHVRLDVAGTPLDGASREGGKSSSSSSYGPGDAVGVLPRNDPALVDGVLAALGLDGDAVFDVAPAAADGNDEQQQEQGPLAAHLGAPCTLRAALSRALDLTTPARKSLLRLLAEHATDSAERHHLLRLCGRDGRAAYSEEIVKGRPTLLDLLSRFPSAARAVPAASLIDALPPLAPRMYSVASSPAEQPGSLDFAFSAVTVEQTLYPGPVADGKDAAEAAAASASGATREGVATGWLQRLLLPSPSSSSSSSSSSGGAYLPVFLRRAVDFRPPEDLATPVVMIGPGTGVAPFRGFLQQRRAQAAIAKAGTDGGEQSGSSSSSGAGPAWLYFGCRRRDEDCLFAEDWEAFVADGTLTRLRLAFSRDPAANAAAAEDGDGGDDKATPSALPLKKTYVQHLMAEDAEELGELIVAREARVYVCGDGAQMAKDVHAELARIVARALLKKNGGAEGEEAGDEAAGAAELAAMAKAGRYVRDIWC